MSQVVFIASSKEAREKGVAEKVARSLSERGLVPLRWWQSVRQGSFTLDVLKAISENVDAAVIVWDADDSTWYRGTSVATARDNCLLEVRVIPQPTWPVPNGYLRKEGTEGAIGCERALLPGL